MALNISIWVHCMRMLRMRLHTSMRFVTFYVVVPSIALQLLLSFTRDSCSHAVLSCNGRPGFQLAVATSGKLPDVSNEMQKDHACVLSHPCKLLHPFQTIAFYISRDFLTKDS